MRILRGSMCVMADDVVPDTVTEAVALLRAWGYADDLAISGDGVCGGRGIEPAGSAHVDHVFRFEGPSDPADAAIVLGISCATTGDRGIVVDGYGASAGAEHDAVLTMLLRGWADRAR